ncbi:MAG: amidohydrolase [Chloroflexi bacterium]|nr:amidohydrolase [Chloroflexota bacterium]MDL1883255.1 amidohydrolase [Anaerolineae bacterium CFX8]
MSSILERARGLQETMVAWRRDIHMHPEISFQEYRTARLVAEALHEMGIEAETGVGKTGVVGRLGEGRPVIGIRADMDALPIHEANDVPYRSQTPGAMHACGHDAHTAILLGVARLLADMPDRPAGEIRFLFQPSEEDEDDEGKSGATRMIEDGAMEGVDAVIALHVASGIPAGKIRTGGGYASAAVDSFEAIITGEGCHGAYPQYGTDPIYILAQVINAVHGIRARRISPVRAAVISIGSVHGGDANNVIPDSVKINGTIRSFDEETRQKLWDELDRAMSVARALGGDYTLSIRRGYPAMYNDPGVSDLIEQVTIDLFGEEHLYSEETGMGAEDFSYMTRLAPGAMFNLGAKLDSVNRPHHSPIFDLDESVLHIGAAMLAETARRLLIQKA